MDSSGSEGRGEPVRTQRNFENPLVELCRVAGRCVGTPTTVLIFGNGKRRVLMGVGTDRIPSNTPLELICRHTHHTGRLVVQNAATDERFHSNTKRYPANCPAYLLAVPVFDKKHQIIGVLCAMDTNPRSTMDDRCGEQDIESLQIIARQIALQWNVRRGAASLRCENDTLRSNAHRVLSEQQSPAAAQWIREDRLRAALSGSNDGLFDCELLSGHIYCSPRLVELLGYAPGAANLPHTLVELGSLIHPDDRPAVEAALFASVQRALPFRVEFRIRIRSGEYRWFEVRAAVLPDEQGIPHRLAGCVTDIGSRKRSEDIVRERERVYQQAIAAAEGVVYHLDFQTNSYAYIGEGIERLIGFPASQVTPDLWPRIAKPYRYQGSLAPETYKSAGQELRSGRISEWNADYEVTLPEGQTRWIADRAVLILDSESHTMGCIGILQDVTERVLAQRQAVELAQAYDTTIEGWAQALDYRDKETEGHTRRVTELTMRLAYAMGFNREQLINIRRGALLHDIGKMAIPDRILLKPGPLTEEEMEEMKKHTLYAYNLLAPIPFLKEALDIPYSHHEWWDGTGYPQGLRGEQIPLSARLFAVIDVYDALRSDRPYRSAWPEDQVRQHILAASGTHFDPGIVAAFLELLKKDEEDTAWARSQAVA